MRIKSIRIKKSEQMKNLRTENNIKRKTAFKNVFNKTKFKVHPAK